ncbi:MAG: DUF4810 domain-containing protein [Candidatus Cloacimonetes bacterium]|jgi:hypothetical protein|nr:DUF4810 domain-containing protein [Candidatus Cloacimonadota bacterium]MDD4667154.1 DUF4810 domain-containing protein [Candidatus Cloacimonadota bacterium]MDY0336468.1 DUF4810 domain-containing protein [Candidatus Cloacimonadaceae bacterium]
MRIRFGLLAILLLLAACAQPPYLYYGTSSHSYYQAVKKQDEKSVAKYKASLEDVFQKSAKLGKPVPPGLYADYALLLMKEQNADEARVYFQKEMETWSESHDLMNFLMQRYSIEK